MARRDLPPNPVSDVQIEEVSPATVFGSARVAAIHQWWATIAAGRGGAPLWQDFDIVDHHALAPYLFVVETPESGDFRFRLLGEVVIEMIGRNNVGELVRARPDDEYGHGLYDYYRDIVARQLCLKCQGSLAFAGAEHKRFESIDCPMLDDAGRVSRIIGVMDYIV